jgi:hypothetical protein
MVSGAKKIFQIHLPQDFGKNPAENENFLKSALTF